jgi:hypothetical protein
VCSVHSVDIALSGAPKPLTDHRCKYLVLPGRRNLRRVVAITIALSFIAMLLPIASASSDKSSTMACCAGKTAGHCDSGLAAKKPQPPPEPMCGLATAETESDGITIVAEPSPTESHHSHSQTAETDSSSSAAESTSLRQPCHMDCGACATSATRQQKRERGAVQPLTDQSLSLTTLSHYENSSVLFSSSEEWEQTSPRGPPSDLR